MIVFRNLCGWGIVYSYYVLECVCVSEMLLLKFLVREVDGGGG